MARWAEIEAEAPELALAVRERMDAGVHKTIATLRADGSPRISGIEARFAEGELWFGSMPRAVKARDLMRDPRFALHSASADPPEWTGDAKVAGRAAVLDDPERVRALYAAMGQDGPGDPGSHFFVADIDEVVLTRLGEPADHLVIEAWHAGRGVSVRRRA